MTPRYGNKKPKFYKKNKKVNLENLHYATDEMIHLKYLPGVEIKLNEIKDEFIKNVKNLFNGYQKSIENCVLRHDEDGRSIKIKIPVRLEIKEIDAGTNIMIVADVNKNKEDDADLILKANSAGTGVGVNKKILSFFGVDDEQLVTNGNNTGLSQWYFEPTGALTMFSIKLKDLEKKYYG